MNCAGDSSYKCGNSYKSSVYSIAGIPPEGFPFAIPRHLPDKSGWTASASHSRGSDYLPFRAIDSVHNSDDHWSTPVNLQDPYPWLQVLLYTTWAQLPMPRKKVRKESNFVVKCI